MTNYADIQAMTTDEICDFMATLPSFTQQNGYGTIQECLMSGWVNAMDMQDEIGARISVEEFRSHTLSHAENMHGTDWEI